MHLNTIYRRDIINLFSAKKAKSDIHEKKKYRLISLIYFRFIKYPINSSFIFYYCRVCWRQCYILHCRDSLHWSVVWSQNVALFGSIFQYKKNICHMLVRFLRLPVSIQSNWTRSIVSRFYERLILKKLPFEDW